jgi:hypothetical protein
MPLNLPAGSRFQDPVEEVSYALISDFDALIGRVAAQGHRQGILEHFKGYFCAVVGAAHTRSSNESWAYTDLQTYMSEAAKFPPLFVEAFYDACEWLADREGYEVPDVENINAVLRRHEVGLEIRPPDLIRVGKGSTRAVAQPAPPPSLADQAGRVIQESLQRAEDLLTQGRPREAVQEMLWILESLVTAFRGAALPSGTVEGRYFNEIAKELREGARGTSLDRVVAWCVQLHGYLSSPTGGGVRHGMDLAVASPMTQEEGRLYVNLILSYVTFLMSEHASRVLRPRQ